MKQLSSAEFRKQYTAQSEPVEVTAHGKVIGTWIPIEASTSEVPAGALAADTTEESPTRMTIRPVKGEPKTMVATAKRVIDPLESMTIVDRGAYSRFHNRMYGKQKAPKG